MVGLAAGVLCAGEKTPPVELIVERSEILDQIKAEFRFEHEGAVTKGTQVPVVLAVQNGSQAIISFPPLNEWCRTSQPILALRETLVDRSHLPTSWSLGRKCHVAQGRKARSHGLQGA
jgi:hypothetical protein